MGVETGGCPHTAIREDASMNLVAIEDMNRKFPHAELCFVGEGVAQIAKFVIEKGGLAKESDTLIR